MQKIIVTLIAVLAIVLVAGNVRPILAQAAEQHGSRAGRVSSTQKPPPVWIVAGGPETVSPGTVVEVTLKILRKAPTAAPMALNVKLPNGAELVSGLEAETIVDETSPEITRVFGIRIGSVPQKDVSFELLQGTGHPVTRAEAAYRFGRPEPRIALPQRGEAIRLNNNLLLTPVDAGK